MTGRQPSVGQGGDEADASELQTGSSATGDGTFAESARGSSSASKSLSKSLGATSALSSFSAFVGEPTTSSASTAADAITILPSKSLGGMSAFSSFSADEAAGASATHSRTQQPDVFGVAGSSSHGTRSYGAVLVTCLKVDAPPRVVFQHRHG